MIILCRVFFFFRKFNARRGDAAFVDDELVTISVVEGATTGTAIILCGIVFVFRKLNAWRGDDAAVAEDEPTVEDVVDADEDGILLGAQLCNDGGQCVRLCE
jgi:hypothetical protein